MIPATTLVLSAILITLSTQRAPADTHTESVTVAGIERTYAVHTPSHYDHAKPMPLVIFLHGAGGDGLGGLQQTHLDRAADKYGFLAVAPDGYPPFPERPANILTNPRTWNDGSGRGRPSRLAVDDVAFVRVMLAKLESEYRIDPKRVYACGHSNGAAMTFRLGAEMADTFAAIAPDASNCLYPDPHPSRPVPTVFFIGTADPLVPMAGGDVRLPWGNTVTRPAVRENNAMWARVNGCSATPETVSPPKPGCTVERFSGSSPDSVVVCYYIDGLGHAWPGGDNRLPRAIIGNTDSPIDATEIIWAFFTAHPLH